MAIAGQSLQYFELFFFQRYCEGDNYRLVVEVKHVDEKKLEYEYIKKDSVDLIVQRRERFGVGCKVD